MNAAKIKDTRVLDLDLRRDRGAVTLIPLDADRFALRVPELLRACGESTVDELSLRRFHALLERLGTWILDRADLRESFVTIREGGLRFVVVRKTVAYDADFEDVLSNLDIELAHDVDIGFQVDVMSLPAVSGASFEAFLHPHLTLRIVSREQRG